MRDYPNVCVRLVVICVWKREIEHALLCAGGLALSNHLATAAQMKPADDWRSAGLTRSARCALRVLCRIWWASYWIMLWHCEPGSWMYILGCFLIARIKRIPVADNNNRLHGTLVASLGNISQPFLPVQCIWFRRNVLWHLGQVDNSCRFPVAEYIFVQNKSKILLPGFNKNAEIWVCYGRSLPGRK